MLEFSRRPSLLRERLEALTDTELARPILLDEVQKVPQLLDEVHWLIEKRGLKQEIFDEGLTRNIPAFSRFFEAVGYSQGQLTNYANIARDCGVDAKTVREYYQILVDTLMGSFLPPYKKRQELSGELPANEVRAGDRLHSRRW